MGIETAIVATALLSVVGGGMSMVSSNKQAKSLEGQGDLALLESIQEANTIEEQGRQFQASQKMKYIMSGVSVAGSPLLALDDTANKVQAQVKATKDRGIAQKNLEYDNADVTRSEGRVKFLSGLVSAGTGAMGNFSSVKSAGMFGNATGSTTAASKV